MNKDLHLFFCTVDDSEVLLASKPVQGFGYDDVVYQSEKRSSAEREFEDWLYKSYLSDRPVGCISQDCNSHSPA